MAMGETYITAERRQALQAELAACLARATAIAALLSGDQDVPPAVADLNDNILGFTDPSGWLTPADAAARFGGDPSTIRRWCRKKGIGRRPRGRWEVSVTLLKAYLAA